MPVITGATAYPDDRAGVPRALPRRERPTRWASPWSAAAQKALNLVLLGMFSRHLPFEEEAWRDAIAACVPPRTLEVNLAAFERGRALMG